jgi:hypothetical protein
MFLTVDNTRATTTRDVLDETLLEGVLAGVLAVKLFLSLFPHF